MRPTRKTNNHKYHPHKVSIDEVHAAFDLLSSVALEYLSNDREDEYEEAVKANDIVQRFLNEHSKYGVGQADEKGRG